MEVVVLTAAAREGKGVSDGEARRRIRGAR